MVSYLFLNINLQDGQNQTVSGIILKKILYLYFHETYNLIICLTDNGDATKDSSYHYLYGNRSGSKFVISILSIL